MGADEDGERQASSSTQPTPEAHDDEVVLKKLHILPLKEADKKIKGRQRMDFLAETLRQLRNTKAVVCSGDLVKAKEAEFVVIKCDPPQGCLGMETDFFVDGAPVICFQKIQFSAWGPSTLSSEELFNQYVRPYFKGEYSPYGTAGVKRVRLLYTGQVVQVGEVSLQVEATEPQGLGMVSTDTEIFANWDQTPEFEKVHILPFLDTLPSAYQYELFGDYLKPFLVANPHKKYQHGDLFTYQGVQFKVVACEPDAVARIGKSTTIFCQGHLTPTLRNLLPPHLMNQVAQLPQGLQMLLLSSERTTRELEEMLSQRRGLFPQTIEEIHSFNWPPSDVAPAQQTCMVCLEDFQLATPCRRLPCGHVFHQSCIDEWLRRCTDCPICKANVDRAIRNYCPGLPCLEALSMNAKVHVDRALNVIGSGLQHKVFFRDFLELIRPLFTRSDFDAQPRYIADTGCGDGSLLGQIYEFVKTQTPRGRVLQDFPLTMIGIDLSASARSAAADTLRARGVPHLLVEGDIGDPGGLCQELQQWTIDPRQVLHVRSFLDHDRPYHPPDRPVPAGSPRDRFVAHHFHQAAYLDRAGDLIKPVDLYQSLVEHFERWADASGQHGLCILEAMLLDVPNTVKYFDENVSFHFDIEAAFSRQYLVPPVAYCMALAEAGLFSCTSDANSLCYPESGEYCRIISQHVKRSPFRVRLADDADLDALAQLQQAAKVSSALEASPETLASRLKRAPLGTFVAERGGKLLGAAYTTRLQGHVSRSNAEAEPSQPSAEHGEVLQLVALHALPEAQGVGSLLRDLLLQLAQVDPNVHSVVGLTRFDGWAASSLSQEDYIRRHVAGELSDKVLAFHTQAGAEILGLVANARPSDVANQGAAVLIRYEPGRRHRKVASTRRQEATIDEVEAFIHEQLGKMNILDKDVVGKCFAELGLDSLELAGLRRDIEHRFGLRADATAMTAREMAKSCTSCTRGGPTRATERQDVRAVVESCLLDFVGAESQSASLVEMGLDSLDLATQCDPSPKKFGKAKLSVRDHPPLLLEQHPVKHGFKYLFVPFRITRLGIYMGLGRPLVALKAMDRKLELNRFMGSWYVLAHIPVRLVKEHLAHNAVETYSWDESSQRIGVHYRFNENALDGRINDSYQRGWLWNKETSAEWRVSPKLPLFGYFFSHLGLKLPYIIVDCAEDYSQAIVGYPNRAYLWILSRKPTVSDADYQKLIQKSKDLGYDEAKIRKVPQVPDAETFQVPS
ncbi:TIL [Symbiodinium natans]|uniref:TIL protein n=1 Tax=Symbiodinium natans TaxID=878477 RepID=A0A812SZ76_9DINO|nr:TIL [Symbiodinium natans]